VRLGLGLAICQPSPPTAVEEDGLAAEDGNVITSENGLDLDEET
jgi:hypothetical protein